MLSKGQMLSFNARTPGPGAIRGSSLTSQQLQFTPRLRVPYNLPHTRGAKAAKAHVSFRPHDPRPARASARTSGLTASVPTPRPPAAAGKCRLAPSRGQPQPPPAKANKKPRRPLPALKSSTLPAPGLATTFTAPSGRRIGGESPGLAP